MENREEKRLELIEEIHKLNDYLLDSCRNYSIARTGYWLNTMNHEFSELATKLNQLNTEYIDKQNINELCIH
jgi:hypothetical protein